MFLIAFGVMVYLWIGGFGFVGLFFSFGLCLEVLCCYCWYCVDSSLILFVFVRVVSGVDGIVTGIIHLKCLGFLGVLWGVCSCCWLLVDRIVIVVTLMCYFSIWWIHVSCLRILTLGTFVIL